MQNKIIIFIVPNVEALTKLSAHKKIGLIGKVKIFSVLYLDFYKCVIKILKTNNKKIITIITTTTDKINF